MERLLAALELTPRQLVGAGADTKVCLADCLGRGQVLFDAGWASANRIVPRNS
jgi:hypothetical protein